MPNFPGSAPKIESYSHLPELDPSLPANADVPFVPEVPAWDKRFHAVGEVSGALPVLLLIIEI